MGNFFYLMTGPKIIITYKLRISKTNNESSIKTSGTEPKINYDHGKSRIKNKMFIKGGFQSTAA